MSKKGILAVLKLLIFFTISSISLKLMLTTIFGVGHIYEILGLVLGFSPIVILTYLTESK